MSLITSGIFRSIETEFIKEDSLFFFELMMGLSARNSAGVLIHSLFPYVSLFTVETYNYFTKFHPKYTHTLSNTYRAIIKSSRMRTKFFDDTQLRIDGIFELLIWILDFHHEWHINKHKGFLSSIKRHLQKDMGITFYNSHIIGTTHTSLVNVGYTKTDLPTTSSKISTSIGPLSFAVGRELGEYLGSLVGFPEFAPDYGAPKYFSYKVEDNLLGYKDEKSESYLSSIFNGTESKVINLSLMFFLTQVNFSHYILDNLVTGSPITLFKIKYIVLYHLVSNLKKLQNYSYQNQLLSEHSNKYLRAIIKNKELQEIAAKSKFRNILVHYVIEEVSEKIISPTTELYGLVEHFFNGKTYSELVKLVDAQMERVSVILEEWLNW